MPGPDRPFGIPPGPRISPPPRRRSLEPRLHPGRPPRQAPRRQDRWTVTPAMTWRVGDQLPPHPPIAGR